MTMSISRDVTIINRLGLHARAAARFVNLASQYEAAVEVERNGQKVNGKSIMGVMMLAAAQGSSIKLHADGSDAEDALSALVELIAQRFGEDS
jgi:phosphocarrier protein HPr